MKSTATLLSDDLEFLRIQLPGIFPKWDAVSRDDVTGLKTFSQAISMFFTSARLLMLTGLISFSLSPAGSACQDSAKPVSTKAVGTFPGDGNRSVILLLNKPLVLSDTQVQQAVMAGLSAKAGVEENSPPGQGNSIVRKNGDFLVHSGTKHYTLRFGRSAFFSKEQLADLDELRTRKRLNAHTAWVAVELIPKQPDETAAGVEPAAYRQMCTMLVKCLQIRPDAEPSVLGVLVPGKNIILAAPDNVTELLQDQDPIAALETAVQTPVLDAGSNAAEMKAATKKAQQEWPTFVQAFRKRTPAATHSFNVLMPFRDGEKTEIMWIEVTGIDGDTVRGTLANQPALLTTLKQGDPVTGAISNLSDWIYTDPVTEQPVGGFLVELLSRESADATQNQKQ